MFWSGSKDPALPGIANKIVMVVPGFVAKKGKFEAILAGGFPVAPSSVAAVFRKDGDKVVGEGNGGGLSRSHFDRLRNGEFTVGGSESGFASGENGDETGRGDSNDIGWIAVVAGGVSKVGWCLTRRLRFLSEDKLVCIVKVL
jgi:hypothetical protein